MPFNINFRNQHDREDSRGRGFAGIRFGDSGRPNMSFGPKVKNHKEVEPEQDFEEDFSNKIIKEKPKITDGIHLFHGTIKFKLFGRPLFISTGRQIGFLSGIIALLVMGFSIIAVFTALSTSSAETKKNYIISAIILIIISIIIIYLIISSIVKVFRYSLKQEELERAKVEAEVAEAEARAKIAQEELNLKSRFCEYCNAKIAQDEDKCPNCGSKRFIIKK